MQHDPIKSTLKPPGTKLLKLTKDERLSSLDFDFNLRRCITVVLPAFNAIAATAVVAGRVSRVDHLAQSLAE